MATKESSSKGFPGLIQAEEEENYRSLIASMSEGFAIHELVYDGEGNLVTFRYLDVNPAFEKSTGLLRGDVIGRTHQELFPQDGNESVRRILEVVMNGVPAKVEAFFSGNHYYNVYAYKVGEHKFGVIFTDVTGQKRSVEHQDWLASFPENNPQPVLEVNSAGNIVYQNNTAAQFYVPPGTQPFANRLLDDLEPYILDLTEGKLPRVRDIKIDKSWFRQFILYLPDIQHLRLYSSDITDQVESKQALETMNTSLEELVSVRTLELIEANRIVQQTVEQKLALEQASFERERKQFQTLIDLLPVYLVILTADYEVIMANRYFREQLGDPDGMKCYECLFKRDLPCEVCESFRPFVSLGPHQWEWEGPNGRIYEVYDFPYKVDEKMMILELGIDITKIKQAQSNLDRSNRYNRSLIEINLDALMTVNRAGKMADVNETAVAVSGYNRSELIGMDFLDLFSDKGKAAAALINVQEMGSLQDHELELKNRDGKVIPVSFNGIVFTNDLGERMDVFASLRDLTEFKRKEEELRKLNKDLENLIAEDLIMHEQLVQSEKLAALGRMLASITHEINNPLQTIKNSLYLIQEDFDPDNPDREYLEIATNETKRISNLVAQLREIYRPASAPPGASFCLQTVVDEVGALLHGQLDKGKVEWVVSQRAAEPMNIEGSKDQIKQVFINICNNAIEAMQPHGGKLEVLFLRGAPGSKEVGVIIRDTGPGIAQEYLDRLFEPFQTTKVEGVGLGLAISYEIILRHKGRLIPHNYEHGAEFTVWLPTVSRKV